MNMFRIHVLRFVGKQLLHVGRPFLEVNIHLTSTDFSKSHFNLYKNTIDEEVELLLGRFNLNAILDELPRSSDVYYCGASVVHDQVQNICKQRGLGFYAEIPYTFYGTSHDSDGDVTLSQPMSELELSKMASTPKQSHRKVHE